MHPLHINCPQHDTYLIPVLSADKHSRKQIGQFFYTNRGVEQMPFSQDRLDDELAVLCVVRKIDFRLVSILASKASQSRRLLCKEKLDT